MSNTSLILLLLVSFLVPIQIARARQNSANTIQIIFYDPLHNTGILKDALAAVIEYDVSELSNTVNKNALLISTVFDDQVNRHLQSGGRAIILCNSLNAFPDGAPFKVRERDNKVHKPMLRIDAGPFRNLSGFENALEPKFVITNLRNEIPEDVFARADSDDQNSGPIAAMQMYAAGGRIFVTTFPLEKYVGNDYAKDMLRAIIAYTMSSNFTPKYDWHIREE